MRSRLSPSAAVEREVSLELLTLDQLAAGRSVPIGIAAGREEESLSPVGAIVRTWEAVAGALRVSAAEVSPGLHRLTAVIENQTPWSGGSREAAMRRTFCSTHTVLRAEAGEFVSLTDPRPAGCGCRPTTEGWNMIYAIVIAVLVLLGLGWMVKSQTPEVRRYLKVRKM
jgi:hypothetical protein